MARDVLQRARMHRCRHIAVGLACAAAAVTLLRSEIGQAGTITINAANITRKVGLRGDTVTNYWINRSDCFNDDVITFPLYVANYANGPGIQAWVSSPGNDCTTPGARKQETATCWKVFEGTATSNTISVDIRVRDVVGQHKPPSTGVGSGTVADCSSSSTSTPPQDVVIYFMFVSSTGDNLGGISYATKYDLVGPVAPTGLKVGSGETLLKLDWNQSTDTDLTSYKFFCDPPRGSEGDASNVREFEASVVAPLGVSDWIPSPPPGPTADGSADDADPDAGSGCDPDGGDAGCVADGGDDSGVDAQGTSDATTSGDAAQSSGSSCPSTKLVAGADPVKENLMSYVCGQASGSVSGRITGLHNAVTYTVAIAGVDTAGNIGLLSTVGCDQPWPVDDFFKIYRQAGGGGGGGFCSIGAVGRGAGLTAFGIFGMAALLRVVRRRRGR